MSEGNDFPRLRITYAWVQREEGNFSHLVPQLSAAGIRAAYDAVELRCDLDLAEWVERKVCAEGADGWAYVLTAISVMRRPCADGLARAVERLIERNGADFPAFGLLYGIAEQSLPPVLRARPCFHLADPGWKERVAQMLKKRSDKRAPQETTRYRWCVHKQYGGDPEAIAVEVGARTDCIPYWRFAVPKWASPSLWGQGRCGGGEISPVRFSVARGSARIGNCEVEWFGAANAVSPTESAYAVFHGRLPEFICFGPARGPQGPPGKMEMFHPKRAQG